MLDCYNRIVQEHAHQFYKDWTSKDFPRVAADRDPARQPVLRRLVRGELAEPRPLRRRDHLRADSVHREEVSRPRHRAGRASSTADRPAAGKRSACRCSIPTNTTAAMRRVRIPIDFRAYTVVDIYKDKNAYLSGRAVGARAAAGHAQLSRAREHHARGDESPRARARHEEPLRPAVGHLGSGLLAGRRRRLSEAHLGQAHRRDRSERGEATGRRTTTWRTSCGATGRRASAGSSRARSTSTSATWTTTT